MQTFRLAAFQRRPLFDDIAGTIDRLTADMTWCDDHGVQLAIFPECYLQGYASDRETITRRALSLDGKIFENLLSTLSRFGTDIVLGFAERRATSMYNSAAVIRNGRVLGAYAKTHPNEPGFNAGQDYPVFDQLDWRFGINICNDANFGDAAQKISAQGARLLCYPLNNMLPVATAAKWRSKSIHNLQQRAFETGCWVASSDVVGECGEKISHGCTCIVRPDGSIVERVTEGAEGVIMADLD